MKNILLLLMMLLLPMAASAYDVEIGGIYYDVVSKAKVAEVTFGEKKYSGDIVIPSTIEYEGVLCDVKFIGGGAFTDCDGLVSLKLNEGIETIKSGGIQVVRNLKSVTIPRSLKTIEEWNFTYAEGMNVYISDLESWCHMTFHNNNLLNGAGHLYINNTEISDLILPGNFEWISDRAFSGCANIKSVTIEEGIRVIGNSAFDGCPQLATVSFPASIESIKSFAFAHCPELTNVSLPHVQELGNYVFGECSKLQHITLPNDLNQISMGMFSFCTSLTDLSFLSNIITIGENAFDGCTGLRSIDLPNSVVQIGRVAFAGCTNVESILLPSSVNMIDAQAFADCKKIKDVYCYAKNIPQTEGDIFAGSYIEYSTLHVPVASIDDYKSTAPWSDFKTIVGITETEPMTYKLIYMVDGEEYRAYDVEDGASIIPETSPTKDGYTFSGWINLPETMPAHDVIITGYFVNSHNNSDHEYVDLGLPSGLLWATCNIGANAPEEVGDLFAWGETSPKTTFTQSNYVFFKSETTEPDADGFTTTNSGYTKYVMESEASKYGLQGFFDNLSVLEKEDDAAYVLWGEQWRIPTWDDINELRNQCTWTWVTLKGVDGYKVTGPNGNFIFFPAAGFIESYTLSVGQGSMYWGSSLSPTYPKWVASLYFYKVVSDGWHAGGFEGERYYGHSIRPVYEYPTHKITYLIDGNEYKSFMIKEGETITPEIEPTKEGFTFSGWSEIPETMPSNDVTVTGTFTINSYTLTYMVDGKEYKKASVKYGSSITAEAAPTKEGYTFSGWSGIPKTMPAHDVTVTGTFTINSYTLTYMVDGQVFKTVSVKYGSTITTEAAPTKEGYTFSGWDNIPATMPAHDVTVTGTFTINKYKVTFVVDGQVYGTTEIEYGADVNPIEEPSKEGYTFSGWQNLPEDMPSHDIIVTGTFTINKYIITFVVDGQVYGTTEIEYGADVNPIEEPTKEGYTFSGWQNLPEDMPAHDITITGTFTVNQYKVTFKYGKNVLTTIDVDYGAVIPLPESLNSERYTLIEWLDVPETMPARDIIIYADYVDGIDNITADSKDVQYIQMDGMYTNELKQGLNIIRMKDGTTKKVWVK